jgi:CheY-like chemotaxis protein
LLARRQKSSIHRALTNRFERFPQTRADGGRPMKARILIVENDAALSRTLAENFVSEGFEVRCLADANLAVSKVNDFAPDLVLLDVTQPRRSGFEICAVLPAGGRRRSSC